MMRETTVAFADNDPLEDDMGVRCENMNPDQLVAYIKSYQQAFGLNLKVDGFKERGVFRGLQKLYGQQEAGRIVKWAFYHYKGQFRAEPVGFFMFWAVTALSSAITGYLLRPMPADADDELPLG
jgi:hypothetical protein